ncbi:retrovirus-related Pol polyprotein from transposon 297 [Trichonephila clavipes]|nr:retrovirus-related Pol polyprotein from transposon 297 [Trichonephila clavipes]
MEKNLRTPQTLVYEEWMEEENTSQSVVEYILQLNNRLKRCQDIAITRMKECQLKKENVVRSRCRGTEICGRGSVSRQINILREEIKRLLELGVIEIGQSDYTSPLILVESPNKDPRPCVDYRRLNEITRAEFFPLPNMEEIVEK